MYKATFRKLIEMIKSINKLQKSKKINNPYQMDLLEKKITNNNIFLIKLILPTFPQVLVKYV